MEADHTLFITCSVKKIAVADEITYVEINPCGNLKPLVIDGVPNGNITSPNYPDAYPPSSNWEWEIRANQGEVVALTLVELDLETG